MPGTSFTASNWLGYAEQSATNPDSALTDFPLLIDVSTLPASWKSAVQSDGGDIRVTKADGTELAYDLIAWAYNAGSPTGIIRAKWSGALAASGVQQVRVYAGYLHGTAVAYDANETYGSDNAYPSSYAAYFPMDGDANDRTSSGKTGAVVGATQAAGQVGSAYEFSATSDRITTNITTLPVSTMTYMQWVRLDSDIGFERLFEKNNDIVVTMLSNTLRFRPRFSTTDPAWDITLAPGAALRHVAIAYTSGTRPTAYINGSEVTVNESLAPAGTPQTSADPLTIGNRAAGDRAWNGLIDEWVLTNDILPAAWVKQEYDQSNDQAAFWGAWAWEVVPASGSAVQPAITSAIRSAIQSCFRGF